MMTVKMQDRTLGFVFALALLTPMTLAAQEIQVKDIATGAIIETVEPGGTITIHEGEEIRLIMSVQAKGRTYYPYTKYWKSQPRGSAVRITKASVENANVTLLAIGNAGQSENISYEITENVRGRLQGSVTIRIQAHQQAQQPEDTEPSGHRGTGWAGEITDTLYHAILLRDMDASGGRSYSDRIGAAGSYAIVAQVAQEIARSQESRVDIYQRQITNRQRLDALYQHLLKLGSDDIDEQDWSDNLRRLNEGRIAEVVAEMVRSQRFREIQGL